MEKLDRVHEYGVAALALTLDGNSQVLAPERYYLAFQRLKSATEFVCQDNVRVQIRERKI